MTTPDEYEHQGWKVYVSDGRYGVRLGCVTDTLPLHRMTFDFGPDEAREIATDLLRFAELADQSPARGGPVMTTPPPAKSKEDA